MALINCPECGEKVSDSANKCVHCGCTYTVCPECGSVYTGEKQVCPNCGFSIRQKASDEAKSDGVIDINQVWQSRNATDKTVMRIIAIARIAVIVLFMVFFVAAYVLIEIKWDGTIEQILQINNLKEESHGLIVAGCVIGALMPIVDNAGSVYMEIMCGDWMRKNKFDFTPHLKKASSQVEVSALPEYWDYASFSSAAYLSAVPHDRTIKLVKYSLNFVLAVLIAVTAGICLTQNVDEFIASKLYGSQFKFKYAALIVAVVFLICYFVVNFLCERAFDKRKEKWLQSVL